MSTSNPKIDRVASLQPSTTKNNMNWKELVEEQIKYETLLGVTCRIYPTKLNTTTDGNKPCVCGRLPRQHSFTNASKDSSVKGSDSKMGPHPTKAPLSVYGAFKDGPRVCQ